jgi:hypothetical protein
LRRLIEPAKLHVLSEAFEEAHMKRSALAVVAACCLALTMVASAAAGPARPERAVVSSGAPALPPCTPTISTVKIDGKSTTKIAECGPATATLTEGGKTYKFANGYCMAEPSAMAPLSLTLGTQVGRSTNNGGLTDFSLMLSTTKITSTQYADDLDAEYSGKDLASAALVTAKDKTPSSGTFTADTTLTGSKRPQFTGSWNCHGSIYTIG